MNIYLSNLLIINSTACAIGQNLFEIEESTVKLISNTFYNNNTFYKLGYAINLTMINLNSTISYNLFYNFFESIIIFYKD